MNVKLVMGMLLLFTELSAMEPAKIPSKHLFDAIDKGNIELIKKALDSGISANAWVGGLRQRTALRYAIEHRDVNAVRLLLERGAHPNLIFRDCDETNVHYVASAMHDQEKMFEIARLLLQHGAEVNITNMYGQYGTPLEMALLSGNRSLARLFIMYGSQIDVNISERALQVLELPLYQAIVLGNYARVEKCLATEKYTQDQLETALVYAAGQTQESIISLLLPRVESVHRAFFVVQSILKRFVDDGVRCPEQSTYDRIYNLLFNTLHKAQLPAYQASWNTVFGDRATLFSLIPRELYALLCIFLITEGQIVLN